MISAGAIAKLGMLKNNGEKITDNKNKNPVVRAVRPVRPPAVTPSRVGGDAVMQGERHLQGPVLLLWPCSCLLGGI